MANDNFLDDIAKSQVGDDQQNDSNDFYADDVAAAAIADNNLDPDKLVVDDEIPVQSGEQAIGDLDADPMLGQGSEESYDEEVLPSGDNVVNEDLD